MNTPLVYSSIKGKPTSEIPLESDVFNLAQAGNSEALGKLYDAYFDRIYSFIYYRTSHEQTAEDLTEEVFIKALRALPSLKGGLPKLNGWLFQIARNTVIDHYRKSNPVVGIEEAENTVVYETSIVDAVQVQTDQRAILSALTALPAEQQQVIKLRFLEEFEISEIATMLGKSEGNIRIIQYRALTKLRSLLKSHTRT